MAGLLDYGAGAASGLETLLERKLKEAAAQRDQQRIDELIRSNQAEEGYRTKALEETSALRRQQADDLAQTRREQEANRQRDDVRARIGLRPIGSTVPAGEYDEEMTVGKAPSALYGFKARGPEGEEYGPQRDITYTGTEAQQLAREKEANGGDANNQVHTVLYKGKPVDANYNPKTQKWTYKGMDITADMGHYEKPPAPDRVLIQTGSGYMPRTQALSEIRQGKEVPLATTSSTRTMEEGAKMLQPHIDSAINQAEQLDRDGLFGPAMSRIRHIAAQAGTIDEFTSLLDKDPEIGRDRRVGKFATTLSLLASGAGRVHGGARGGGSPQMYAQFKAALDDSGTLDMFQGRMEGLNEFIAGYAAGPNAKPGEGGGGGTDPYTEYLNRNKKKK